MKFVQYILNGYKKRINDTFRRSYLNHLAKLNIMHISNYFKKVKIPNIHKATQLLNIITYPLPTIAQ